ncbi:D-2-hydroxyacid dehydrogenase [Dyadobacter frigoris]|uniref:D-2-hydroxyacid dehydrogenase n=1 Tax=Dyadobacter frigoris TaxID=2576211 RepID=A0A4U6D1R5_9BACT|nr:D-2-hydroxyacid dehydrogenase [Dyadobacter frigoris]TKT89768.1 D-2-hydroxyacid dehydrogenase [Dyadobacter frigoris]GLU54000.1 glycerate dehydrogenase [Dyadobacter frigoris]
MNIVILDGYTLNPGDLDWAPISNLGNTTIYDRSTAEEIVERAKDADAVLVNKVVLNDLLLSQLPKLKYIGVCATGYNNIDTISAKKHGITVTNVKAYGPASVAQHTFALLLALVNRIETHSHSVFQGEWSASADFAYWKTPLVELAGKTMGLIGLGDIGTQVAGIALAFGMKVIAYRKNPGQTDNPNIQMVSLEELFKKSDVISLHCPLTDETKNIINRDSLSMMKPTSYLLNTGRGPLINEDDLAQALADKTISGAGLDVLSSEPPVSTNPLLSAPNCVITPHIAWASFESRKRLLQMVADNLNSFNEGNLINVVG